MVVPLVALLGLSTGDPALVRPSQSLPGHAVVRERPAALAGSPAVADGWARRSLVRPSDGTTVVRGPARPVPAMPGLRPTLTEAQAIARVTEAGWPGATEAVLVVTARGRLAWRVDPPASALGPENPVWLVDARSGARWVRHDRVAHEQVRSFAINPILTPDAEDFEVVDLAPMATDLVGEQLIVYNCVPPTGPGVCDFVTIPPSEPGGDFLHPAPDIAVPDDNVQLEDAFAVQSVHHHAEVFIAWLQGMGLPGLLCHAQGQSIALLANYKAYLDEEPLLVGNAAYVGDCAFTGTFGQGPQADWGYDGEVVYHELSHGVVELQMGDGRRLGLSRPRADAVLRDAGAMNEGIADFLASVYSGDPVHAEYVSEVGTGSGRRLDNAMTCPRSLTGEVHFDGELFGAALWDLYLELGEPVLAVLFDTIALLPEDATFEEASATMVSVAEASLGATDAQTVELLLGERGLLDCPRIVPWAELERPLWLRPRGQGGSFEPMQPPPAQLSVELPEGASGFWLRFETGVIPIPGFSPVTEIHALIRYGEPVEFSYSEGEGELILVDAEPTLHLPAIDGEAESDGAWVEAPGGQTVYVVLFNQSPNTTLISGVDVEVVIEPGSVDSGSDSGGSTTGGPMEPSTDSSGSTGVGDPPAQDDDGGCGCRAGSPGSGAAWLGLWLGLGLGAMRRRDHR